MESVALKIPTLHHDEILTALGHASVTMATANVVFNTAMIWWANGLSSPPGHVNPSRHGVGQQGPDKRVQRITRNLFQRMIL